MLLTRTFLVLFLMLLKVVVVTFESLDEILNHDHASENYQAAPFCGASLVLKLFVFL